MIKRFIKFYFIIFLFLLYLTILFFYYNRCSFILVYKRSENTLKIMSKNFSKCIIRNTIYNCMEKNKEIYPTLHSKEYYKSHYFNKSIYENFHTNYNVLITPHININIKIVVGIPVGPSELISRIAIRKSWGRHKMTINNKEIFYLFIMSKPDNNYPFQYLVEESHKYNDMLLFDFINSYKHITLLMIMSYKWIKENCRNISIFIRSNSDVLLFPLKLHKLIDIKSDIIAYKTSYNNITYPSGSFYIFSMRFAYQIVVLSKTVRPIHHTEDVYYGQIMKNIKIKNITWFGLEYYLPLSYFRKKKINIKNTSLISIHPITPSAFYYFLNN